MIIPDLNLLLYAHNAGDRRYDAARLWWNELLIGEETVGIPLAVSVGFVRLTTNPSVLLSPMTGVQAITIVKAWFQHPQVIRLDAGDNHFNHLEQCLIAAGRAGRLVTDAHLAALALDHDAEIHTADQDFGVFPDIRWRNPL